MTDEQYISLIKEIEMQKGRLSGHEDVCGERYKNLDHQLTTVRDEIAKVVSAVASDSSRSSKWRDRILFTTIAALFAFATWAAGQLWSSDVTHPQPPSLTAVR